MNDLSVVDSEPFKEMEAVAKEMMRGHSEFTAARRLNMKVTEVRGLWNQFKERLDNDSLATDVARDYLNMMVKQYDNLILELNSNLDDLKTLEYDEKISAQINTTVRNIADIQAKRVDTLQKAGILDNNDLGDEFAKLEEEREAILQILRDELCPACRKKVMQKLAEVSGKAEVVVVYND